MSGSSSQAIRVKEVWQDNVVAEFENINNIISAYRVISFDNEFARSPVESSMHSEGLNSNVLYFKIKANIEIAKPIQIGLVLSNESGNLPCSSSDGECIIWQFNIVGFHKEHDFCVLDQVDLDVHASGGISVDVFGAFLEKTLINAQNWQSLTFICFDIATDVAYLIKSLTLNQPLSEILKEFINLVGAYMGTKIFDVRHLVKYCPVVPDCLKKKRLTNLCKHFEISSRAWWQPPCWFRFGAHLEAVHGA